MKAQRGPRKTFTVELPAELVDALDAAAHERVVGRRLLIELLLTQAVAALRPPSEMRLLPAAPASTAARSPRIPTEDEIADDRIERYVDAVAEASDDESDET